MFRHFELFGLDHSRALAAPPHKVLHYPGSSSFQETPSRTETHKLQLMLAEDRSEPKRADASSRPAVERPRVSQWAPGEAAAVCGAT